MKSKIILLFIVLALFGTGSFFIFRPQPQPMPHIDKAEVAEKTDPIQYLIHTLDQGPKGLYISPKTTAELQAYFAEATPVAVPRIFVKKLPSDFAEYGNKDLYAQIIAALILRENEKVLTERAILILLKAKQDNKEQWTDVEKDYFLSLVQKYDSKSKRETSAEMSDLFNKLDIIPPIVAVVQSATRTNWGTINMESPFGQMEWIDSQTYDYVPFDSLIKATENYANEMNGLPSLQDWRVLRESLRRQRRPDVGNRVLRVLGDYQPEDQLYAQKLQEKVKELGSKIPDSLAFLKQISFDKGSISIQTKDENIPLEIEIAKSPKQQQRGLMFRGNLPEGTGMLFLNDSEQPVSMWMKNTYIPLDIIYFDKSGKIKTIIENAEPLSLESRASDVPVIGVLELPAGFVKKHNIRLGDKIKY